MLYFDPNCNTGGADRLSELLEKKMARPSLWTIRDPMVRAIVGANRHAEEQQNRPVPLEARKALDSWLATRATNQNAGYTKCIHYHHGKRCQRRARYFGLWAGEALMSATPTAGGGLCYEDALPVRDQLHPEDRECLDAETARRNATK